jgi:hypothetical protein
VAEPDWRVNPAPLRGVLAAGARRRAALLNSLGLARSEPRRRCTGIEGRLAAEVERSRPLVDACRNAAHLAAHAVPWHAAAVEYDEYDEYDDRDRSALAHFPWTELRRRIFEKLDERRTG